MHRKLVAVIFIGDKGGNQMWQSGEGFKQLIENTMCFMKDVIVAIQVNMRFITLGSLIPNTGFILVGSWQKENFNQEMTR